MKNKIIIGLGFGDEGKGLMTDYLISLYPDSLVVRFSGGHQVGHTVVADKIKHKFSNFGSGTLKGCPTYWSKYCTIEPTGLVKELNILKSKKIIPKLYIDKDAMITTPYDIAYNIDRENQLKHGSVGVGFGSTIERNENKYSLTFKDLSYSEIFNEKLHLISEDYYKGIKINGKILNNFYQCCCKISSLYPIYNNLPESNSYVFEGSQGLLLDQNFGFFPNVTRANTGTKNALEMIKDEDFEIYLVTRAYQTRHGNGFMTNEEIPHNIKIDKNEANIDSEYQGKFRRSILDLSLIEYAISKDDYIRQSKNKKLVITCLDHIQNEYRFTYKGEIIYSNSKNEFLTKILEILNIKHIYISHSSNSKNINRFYP